MKILGIMGSPRMGGNTDILLDAALGEGVRNGCSTRKIALAERTIAPCNGCLQCSRTGNCVIMDDMQAVYDAIREANGIIWATPVYHWSMSAQTKTALDRTYALTFPTLQMAGKIGGAIVVAGNRGCTNTTNIFYMYFHYHHMPAVDVAYGYAREKGEIQKDLLAIRMAQEMIRQMIAMGRDGVRYPAEFDLPLPRWVKKK